MVCYPVAEQNLHGFYYRIMSLYFSHKSRDAMCECSKISAQQFHITGMMFSMYLLRLTPYSSESCLTFVYHMTRKYGLSNPRFTPPP